MPSEKPSAFCRERWASTHASSPVRWPSPLETSPRTPATPSNTTAPAVPPKATGARGTFSREDLPSSPAREARMSPWYMARRPSTSSAADPRYGGRARLFSSTAEPLMVKAPEKDSTVMARVAAVGRKEQEDSFTRTHSRATTFDKLKLSTCTTPGNSGSTSTSSCSATRSRMCAIFAPSSHTPLAPWHRSANFPKTSSVLSVARTSRVSTATSTRGRTMVWLLVAARSR
mmetsp:Transcript_32425/g.84177  ORF Transcript_32425/g.84177 Transcript_32425/m.84177 type:complete len:230 (+) Transcript_32425:91-780(+)